MKHRAPRVPPPQHRHLTEISWHSVEPVRWDMGLVSHTVPFQKASYPSPDVHEPAGESADASNRNLALNSIALMVSTAITGGLGLLFWAAAGRLYPVAEVGSASAVIASAVMLATLSNLSLGSMYERFLSLSGHRARFFVVRGYMIVTALALVLGCAFLAVAPVDKMFTNTSEVVTFPLFVAVLSVFALQDQTSSGLGVARWAAAKNVFHAVIKFGLLLAAFETARSTAIIASWAIPAVIASIIVFRSMMRNLASESRYKKAPQLPPRKELWSYFGSAYGITALASLAPLLVPIIVVSTLGTEENAYFSLTWSIVSALYVLIGVLIGPFVAEVAAHPDQFNTLTKRFMTLVCAVAIGGSLFLAFLAPFGLGIIGDAYRENGTIIVQLAAVTIPLSVIGSLYDGLARVRRRMRLAVVVQIAATTIIVAGSFGLASSLGIAAVGWSYLAAEALSASILVVPLIRWIRELSAQARAGTGQTAPDAPQLAESIHGRSVRSDVVVDSRRN